MFTDKNAPSPKINILKLSVEEIQNTSVMFLAQHAMDSSAERRQQFGNLVVYNAILLNTLRSIGLRVTPASDLESLFAPIDCNYIWSIHHHGTFQGHELLASAVAAYRGIPTMGGSAPTRAIGEDKVLAKRVAASVGVGVAEHRIINPADPTVASFPPQGRWILKPRSGVMSNAVARVETKSDWAKALAAAAHPRHGGREFMAEEFIPGLNLTAPVVEGFPPRSLDVFIERGRPADNVLTQEGKSGQTPHYTSEPYSGPGAAEASAAAAKIAAALSPFDYARFDFRFEPTTRRLVFLEVNLACNLAPDAVVALAAAKRGIGYPALVEHILAYSLRRQTAAANPA